jgi:hypothetical protein
LPVVTCPDDVEVCIDAEPFEIGGEMFDPNVYGVGVYSFTLTETNQCGTAECTYYVTVNALPEVVCPDDFSIELSELPLQLTGALPEGGIYSGEGVSDGIFQVDEPGSYIITYFYTDENDCEASCTFEITVEPDPFTCITIDLTSGFQFISSYVIPENPNMLSVMDDVLDNLDYVRNTEGSQVIYLPAFNMWLNGIGDWVNEEGYFVKMTGDDQLEICGTIIDPATPITLNSGFRFVAYLNDEPQDALDAFDGILAELEFARNSNGDQLIYLAAFNQWINGIGDLHPGEGYFLKMNNDAVLVYPPVGGNKSTTQGGTMRIEPVHWPMVTGDPSDAIWTLYITDAFMDNNQLSVGDEIAVFDGEQLVGSLALPIEPTGDANPHLALKAWRTLADEPGYTPGNSFTIKIWRASDGSESVAISYEFLQGGYQGDLFPDANAVTLVKLDGMSMTTSVGGLSPSDYILNIYPNPANNLLNIVTNHDVKKVSLVNYVGNIVHTQRADGGSIQLNVSHYAPGLYFVRIETAEGILISRKVAIE